MPPFPGVIACFELPALALHPIMASAVSREVGWLYVFRLAGAAALSPKRPFEILDLLVGRSRGNDTWPLSPVAGPGSTLVVFRVGI